MLGLCGVAASVVASSAAGAAGIAAVPTFLGAIGFTSTGVVAGKALAQDNTPTTRQFTIVTGGIGTTAAGMQAGMGGLVASGSWFALAQSVAAGGAVAVTLGTVGTALAAGAGVGAAGIGAAHVIGFLC